DVHLLRRGVRDRPGCFTRKIGDRAGPD
ncbi:hypothetical protein THAOC_17269, partial [Thalassiosira oceanica]